MCSPMSGGGPAVEGPAPTAGERTGTHVPTTSTSWLGPPGPPACTQVEAAPVALASRKTCGRSMAAPGGVCQNGRGFGVVEPHSQQRAWQLQVAHSQQAYRMSGAGWGKAQGIRGSAQTIYTVRRKRAAPDGSRAGCRLPAPSRVATCQWQQLVHSPSVDPPCACTAPQHSTWGSLPVAPSQRRRRCCRAAAVAAARRMLPAAALTRLCAAPPPRT